MEKDFNKNPDPMDLLLKQAFLVLDENDTATQKLNDVFATSILNSNEALNVNTLKEKEFFKRINAVGKKGFFTAKKLWVISFLLIAGICVLTYYFIKTEKVNAYTTPKNESTIVLQQNVEMKPLTDKSEIIPKKDSLNLQRSLSYNRVEKRDKHENDPKTNDKKIFKFYEPKRCVILLPSRCCYCIPKGLSTFATSIDSSGIGIDRIDCETVYKTKAVSCIWLTLQTKENSYLKLEDQLKNFAIKEEKGQEIYPFAIKVTNDPKLWSADLKGKSIKVNYNKEINVLLFFKNAEPKIGTKLRINNFIATIKTGDELNLK